MRRVRLSALLIGLIAIPYIDFNQKGNGYFTFKQRAFAVTTFLYGFIVLWVVLIVLGTFLRGPNWNFFGLYEPWDPHKLVPLNNVNLSDYIWVRGGVRVASARLAFDRPDAGDPTLYPSDHLGITARLEFGSSDRQDDR